MQVVPPQAAEMEPERKSSAVVAPIDEGWSMWQWLSTPPGSTSLPAASISSMPAPRPSASATTRPFRMPTSQVTVSAAVTTVPPRMTRS